MRWIIITIMLAFILINLSILGMFYPDMDGGHSFLCNSPLAGDCQSTDSGGSMFANHYLSIIKILSDVKIAGALTTLFCLLIFLLFHLFRSPAAALMPPHIAQKWKYKIFPHRLKLLRWIAYHNKGDGAAPFGLKNYSYV